MPRNQHEYNDENEDLAQQNPDEEQLPNVVLPPAVYAEGMEKMISGVAWEGETLVIFHEEPFSATAEQIERNIERLKDR